jgi:hypothetical protein
MTVEIHFCHFNKTTKKWNKECFLFLEKFWFCNRQHSQLLLLEFVTKLSFTYPKGHFVSRCKNHFQLFCFFYFKLYKFLWLCSKMLFNFSAKRWMSHHFSWSENTFQKLCVFPEKKFRFVYFKDQKPSSFLFSSDI